MIDRRQIEFFAEDVLKALALAPAASQVLGLPRERADAVVFQPTANAIIFLFETSSGSNSVKLSAEAVGALLMSYLVRSSIPLPRRGSKSVAIGTSSLSIICEVELGQPSKARQPEAVRAIRRIASCKAAI